MTWIHYIYRVIDNNMNSRGLEQNNVLVTTGSSEAGGQAKKGSKQGEFHHRDKIQLNYD